MKFTDEQLSFIEDRGHNILVSAAAGSGKTAVIVERVIRLITEDGYSVSELLVVTFTKAAAAEMKDRIRDAISDRLMASDLDERTRTHLSKQMTLIHTADITTIDSFCLNLAREHFNICHIDPSFRVADEGELKLIAEDVMAELLEGRYESGDEEFYRFVDDVSTGRDDSAVSEAIRRVYDFAVARPDPKGYIASMMKEYEAATPEMLDETAFMQELMNIANEKVTLALNILYRALKVCDEAGGPYIYRETIESDIALVESLTGIAGYDSYREALNNISYSTLPRKKDDNIDSDLRELARKLRDRAKNIIKKDLAGVFFEKETDDIIYELRMCLPYVSMLASLTEEYMDRYAAAKRERGVADFSDLEHFALEILGDDETREAVSGRYRELIIDEYQDCNRVQEEIFSAISNGHNYVTVGDVKQSIYSFRDACPELFMDKYERYYSGTDDKSKLITLSKNFRSSRNVTETVNSVFAPIMTKECGGAMYDESQSLHYGGMYKNESSSWRGELLRVECDPDGEEDAVATEARAIAARIHELVGKAHEVSAGMSSTEAESDGTDETNRTSDILGLEDRDSHEIRECGYGDIVILLRSVKNVSDTFAEVFEQEGIPLVFDSQSGYLLSYEIKEIMNLLTIIDNPRQDIPLAGVMMGYFGGFSASEMVHVRSYASGGDLYDSLKVAAGANPVNGQDMISAVKDGLTRENTADKNDNSRNANPTTDKIAVKCRDFLAMLDGYRRQAVYTPIHELIASVISDFSYDHYVRALLDGARREGNLRLLKKRAADYEQTSFHGLFKFLRYIDNMKKYEIDFGEAAGSGHTDAVRIMSIHHSKGLEFPVVFVSTLGRNINKADSRAAMLFDDELGAGVDLVIRERSLKIRTLIKKVIARKKDAAAVSEEMRVLYVAMTRAENKLILTAKSNEGSTVKTDPTEAGTLADLIDIARNSEDGNACYDYIEIPYIKPEETGEDSAGKACESPIRRALEMKESVDRKEVEAILKDIKYVYPYERSLAVPQKVSVSYIKHEAMEEKGVSIASDPRGDRVIPTAGALRGTAVHTAYEHLKLDMVNDKENITRYLDKLVADKKLSQDERGYIKTDDISGFLASDICRRMKEADSRHELYREQPFIISVPAAEVNPDYPDEDRVMVQGIIDVFFIENGKVVVVDYKTDSVHDEQTLIDRYQAQLDYYERALRQLMDARGSEKIIYSVSLCKTIKL